MSIFQNLLVLECASVLAGPAVGAFFAELGATVIKLEPLQGDVTRSWKLASEDPDNDISAYFSTVNWGKHSLALNLKDTRAQTVAQQIAGRADILIANYKPGAAARLGLDAESLCQSNPGLIYAHLTGYGAHNPRTGYDAIIQAESGFLYLNGHPRQPPAKMPVALMDILAAHQLKEAILVALLERNHSQRGKLIEVSLLDSALSALANQASNYLVAGHEPQPLGLEHPNIVPYGNLYPCQQGEIMLAIGSDRHFAELCQILKQPELARDPSFSTNLARVRHREALDPLLRQLIAPWSAQALLHALWQVGIPAGQVKKISEALSDPEIDHLRLQAKNGQQGLRNLAFRPPEGTPDPAQPPHLGQHSREILRQYGGLNDAQLDHWQAAGLMLACSDSGQVFEQTAETTEYV